MIEGMISLGKNQICETGPHYIIKEALLMIFVRLFDLKAGVEHVLMEIVDTRLYTALIQPGLS